MVALPIVICIREPANMSMTTRIEGVGGEVAELAKMLVGGGCLSKTGDRGLGVPGRGIGGAAATSVVTTPRPSNL